MMPPSDDEEEMSTETEEIIKENRAQYVPQLPTDFEPAAVDTAQKVLEVFELGARNIKADWKDGKNRSHVQAHDALMSKLTFLRDSAHSAKWAPGFLSLLDRAHSMRTRIIRNSEKELVREITGCCQVCGTREHQCSYTFELLGSSVSCVECDDDLFGTEEDTNDGYSAKKWLQAKPGQLPHLHDDFCNGFEAIASEEWTQIRKSEDGLPLEYLGMFAVGETCLHKAKLAFFTQNVPMELSYDAKAVLVDFEDAKLKKREFVTATHESAVEHLREVERAETALRSNNKNALLPCIAECHTAWDPVDVIITEKANANLQKEEVVEIEDEAASDDLEEGEIGSETLGPLRKHILIMCGQRGRENLQLECDGRDEQTSARIQKQAASKSKKKKKKPAKRKQPASEDEEEDDDFVPSAEEDEPRARRGEQRPAQKRPRARNADKRRGDERPSPRKRGGKRAAVVVSDDDEDAEESNSQSEDSQGFSPRETQAAVAHSFASQRQEQEILLATHSAAAASSSDADSRLPPQPQPQAAAPLPMEDEHAGVEQEIVAEFADDDMGAEHDQQEAGDDAGRMREHTEATIPVAAGSATPFQLAIADFYSMSADLIREGNFALAERVMTNTRVLSGAVADS